MLNGVSVVPNGNATACINAVVFENCALYHSKCLHQQQSKETEEIHDIKLQHEFKDTNAEQDVFTNSVEISRGLRGAVLGFSLCRQSTSVRECTAVLLAQLLLNYLAFNLQQQA